MMTGWGPVITVMVLFIVLSSGLLFQLSARTRVIEFSNMYTSGISTLVYAILFFAILIILVIAVGVHVPGYRFQQATLLEPIRLQVPTRYPGLVPWNLYMNRFQQGSRNQNRNRNL
ncbi:hypothetical protein Cni_G26069 [Canna indica]|uniref:Uncharacterized protein n=1 Tax=Canna indica TaxID=4628 RepID=A0AAQ3QN12_9LILI|nr:hypothetical protein Cni_G26069 [Canna indica]